MLEGLGLVTLFTILLGGPLVPGLRELRRPRDPGPLDLEPGPARPEPPGAAFRARLRAFADQAGPALPARVVVGRRRPRPLEVHGALRLPPGARGPGLAVVRGAAELGEASRTGRLWVQGDVRVGRGVRLRALACDGDAVLGPGAVVELWSDTAGELCAAGGVRLGLAASAGRALRLEPGVAFRQLRGWPVTTAVTPAAPPGVRPPLVIDDRVVWARGRLSLPREAVIAHGVVVHGDLRVGAGTVIRGDVKSYGHVEVGDGAHVTGNLIAHRNVRLGPGARVDGHVIAEGRVSAAAGVEIGRPERGGGLHARGRVRLAPGVRVFGWVVAGAGGRACAA